MSRVALRRRGSRARGPGDARPRTSAAGRRLNDESAIRRWAPTAGLFLLAGLLARAPGLLRPWFGRDEPYIAVQAQALLRGERLYEDVIDRKPPLTAVVYAGIGRVVGLDDFRLVRLFLLIWIVATACLVTAIIVRLGASWRAGVVGGLLYVLGTAVFQPQDAQAANFELWGALPMVAAVLFAVGAPSRVSRPVAFALAGALVVGATYFKQPYVTMLLPVAFCAVREERSRASLLATGAGLAGAFLLVSTVFGLGEMTRWVWLENTEYRSGLGPDVIVVGGLTLGAFALLHAPAVWLGAHSFRSRRPQTAIVLVWLAASLVGVAVGLRFRGHYYQQALPPLCVLAGLGADAVRSRARAAALGAAAVFAAVAGGAAMTPLAHDPIELDPIASFARAQTDPGDAVLVWGAAPEVQWRIDRPVAGRFVHHRYLVQLGSEDVELDTPTSPELRERWELLLDDLREDPPVLVIDTSTRGMAEFDDAHPEDFPLGRVLREDYAKIATVTGIAVWRYEG